jgi:hypothetical protein
VTLIKMRDDVHEASSSEEDLQSRTKKKMSGRGAPNGNTSSKANKGAAAVAAEEDGPDGPA